MTGVNPIGEIEFRDVKVKVYYDSLSKSDNHSCVWKMRNPDSCYQGIVYMNWETGEITYPEGAVIPEQTEEDREMLPQFIITGKTELDEELTNGILQYLEPEYLKRNRK